jgi:hypothetical protein
MVDLSPLAGAGWQFFGNNGLPLAGGKLFSYAAGTTTPLATFTSISGATPHANPIILDSAGRVPSEVWLTAGSAYKFTLKTSADVEIWTKDNILGIETGLRVDLAASSGSSLVGFIQAGGGAVARTAQVKMREYVSAADFGAVGDGVTNDTTALTNFWNSAIARAGVPHYLDAKNYIVTAAMPVVTVSNVWIEGAGAELHDIGTLMTGTVLTWGGGAAPTTKMVEFSAVSGANNQRLANVKFKGIGLNGLAACGGGIRIASVNESEFDVACANFSSYGMSMEVVAALGEAKDNQRNYIKLQGRQIEAAGFVLQADGDAVANTSKNRFVIDCQHLNTPAIRLINSDNNDFEYVRCFRAGGGTATESIQCLGSNVLGSNCRAERFWSLSTTVALRAYGTGTYTYPADKIQIFSLDYENGTPAPTVDTGAQVNWRQDDSDMDDNAWLAFTPTITSGTGTLTTVASISGAYRKFGKRVEFKYQWSITTNGTGATDLQATLPIAAQGTQGSICAGLERSVTGKGMTGFIDGGGDTTISMRYSDGTYPGVNGGVYNISGTYECLS